MKAESNITKLEFENDVASIEDFTQFQFKENLLSTCEDLSNEKVGENLGIFRTQSNQYWTGRYAGYTWLRDSEKNIIMKNGKPCILHVKPRFGLNISNMLNKIAEDEEFEDYLCSELPPGERMFTFLFDEPLIHASESNMPNRIVSVWSFVILLKKVLERPMMCKMTKQERNFVGKVKGKILFNKQLTRNVLLGHEERIYCEFHQKTTDIPENQILKFALAKAEEYIRHTLSRSKNKQAKLSAQNQRIMQYITVCKTRLANVSEREFSAQEVNRVQLPAMFRYYEPLLKLAKVMILEHNADISTEGKADAEIIPYAVNMPLLFECFCRTLMKEKLANSRIKMLKFVGDKSRQFAPASYGCFYLDSDKSTYISGMIVPDIVCYNASNASIRQYYVLDVKYKDVRNPDINGRRDDRLQLLAYAKIFGAKQIGHIFPRDLSNKTRYELKYSKKIRLNQVDQVDVNYFQIFCM